MKQVDRKTALRRSVAQLLHGRESVSWSCHGECYDAADAVLRHLRSLPVEQRMEAMGMERVGLAHQTCPIECVHYGEVPA